MPNSPRETRRAKVRRARKAAHKANLHAKALAEENTRLRAKNADLEAITRKLNETLTKAWGEHQHGELLYRGTVATSGGGCVDTWVDRDTLNYPKVGTPIAVYVCGCDKCVGVSE